MNVYEFARNYLNPYKVKGNELVPMLCPFCLGGTHKDKETFAINISKLTYNCMRGSCGKTGAFFQLCKEFGVEADRDNFELYQQPNRTYKKPESKIEMPCLQVEKYLALRKISRQTMDLLKVGSDDKGNIMFPYYENGELVLIKYRPAKKIKKGERKAWREEGGKPILWGMDLCTNELPLVIVEGEIDLLSCYESGLKNIVSVPSGAEDLNWVELCWNWLQQFDKIILFGDNDDPGKEMIRKLILKLGEYRCWVVENKYKDANELLYYDGKDAVVSVVENAKEIPVIGLINLADVVPVDVKNIPRVASCIRALDEAIGGFLLGELSVWTGKRGQGKSTLLGQMLLNAVDSGNRVCAYSGELRADRFQYWINLQAAGKTSISRYFDEFRRREISYVEKETLNKIKSWYNGKFWLYDNNINSENIQETGILKIFTYAVKRYDCKMFLIDNLMTSRFSVRNEQNYYRAQAEFVGELVSFAKKYNVHIHLVAHPRKTQGELSNDDISGTSEITDRADNVFSLDRVEDIKAKMECDNILTILKNRSEGVMNEKIGLKFCKVSRRMYQTQDAIKYGWDKTEVAPSWYQDKDLDELPF